MIPIPVLRSWYHPFPFGAKVRNMLRTKTHLYFHMIPHNHQACLSVLVVVGILSLLTLTASAEPIPKSDRFYPLRHDLPPGTNARFAGAAGVVRPGVMQIFEVSLPSAGQVTVYSAAYTQGVTYQAPCKFGLEIGHVHRIKIHDMADYPGVELYPSFEIIDRIHPPGNDLDPNQQNFPVPLEFTAREIEAVIQDRMVNKVVYLEDPQFANLLKRENEKIYTEEFRARENLLKEAELRGRPLVIIRLGSRRISPQEQHLLLGTGGQILVGATTK